MASNGSFALLTITLILSILVIVYQILLWHTEQRLKMLSGGYPSKRWSSTSKMPKQIMVKKAASKTLTKNDALGTLANVCPMLSKRARSIHDLTIKVVQTEIMSFNHFTGASVCCLKKIVNASLNWVRQLGYPFSTIARRIKKMVKQSLVVAFTVVVVALFTTLGIVIQPLYSTPSNWGVALSKFYVALLPILLCVIFIIILWLNIQRIDKEKEQKLIEAFKEAAKEALKEVSEEKIQQAKPPSEHFDSVL